jgi:hypothetical protein
MLSYALIEFAGGVQLLQEAWKGNVKRYTDLDGATVAEPDGASFVVQADYPRPAWAVDYVDPPTPAAPRLVTKLAFRNRYTANEKAAIELVAAHNPAATTQQQQLAAALRASLADQRDARFIDLDRADTRGGVLQLEALGLLASGRALQILDAPVQPHEAYTGEV